jgi:hypothetical protein
MRASGTDFPGDAEAVLMIGLIGVMRRATVGRMANNVCSAGRPEVSATEPAWKRCASLIL